MPRSKQNKQQQPKLSRAVKEAAAKFLSYGKPITSKPKRQRRKPRQSGNSNAPLAINANVRQMVEKNSDTFTRREFIQNIGSNAYAGNLKVLAQPVNPGNSELFPWLSQIARGYQKYRFKWIKFMYAPTCPTTTVGTLYLVPDYNVDVDASFDVSSLYNYKNAVTGNVWSPLLMVANMDMNSYKSYFIRDTQYQVLNDAKTYDVFRLYLGTTGANVVPTTIGQLWVEYSVEMIDKYVTPASELAYTVSKQFLDAGVTAYGSNAVGTPTATYGALPLTWLVGGDYYSMFGAYNAYWAHVEMYLMFQVLSEGSGFGDVSAVTFVFSDTRGDVIGQAYVSPPPELVNDDVVASAFALLVPAGCQFYFYYTGASGTLSSNNTYISLYNAANITDTINSVPDPTFASKKKNDPQKVTELTKSENGLFKTVTMNLKKKKDSKKRKD
jgi:hypothetical protein